MAELDTTQGDDSFERVQEFIKSQVRDYLKEAQPSPQTQHTTSQPTYEEQLKGYVDPVVTNNPLVRQAHFKAFDVEDKVDFYANPENYAYRDQVEAGFKNLADAGRATKRQDVLNWILGSEYAKDPVGFTSKQMELRQAQLERARHAGDFGSGSLGRESRDGSFPSMHEFAKLSSDEQSKLLEGMTF